MAVLTLTSPTAEDARIAHAFGVEMGLGRSATLGEIKQDFIKYAKEKVRRVEQREAYEANLPTDVTFT